MISRNVRSSFATSMHDRSVLSHIKLSNLMCIRCIKRLMIDSRHICVTRVNRKKCRYCAQQRHKCVFVNFASARRLRDAAYFCRCLAFFEIRRWRSRTTSFAWWRRIRSIVESFVLFNLVCAHSQRALRLKNTSDSFSTRKMRRIIFLFILLRKRLA
jgi:hypothetical protein